MSPLGDMKRVTWPQSQGRGLPVDLRAPAEPDGGSIDAT